MTTPTPTHDPTLVQDAAAWDRAEAAARALPVPPRLASGAGQFVRDLRAYWSNPPATVERTDTGAVRLTWTKPVAQAEMRLDDAGALHVWYEMSGSPSAREDDAEADTPVYAGADPAGTVRDSG